jgi:hypothetical protein
VSASEHTAGSAAAKIEAVEAGSLTETEEHTMESNPINEGISSGRIEADDEDVQGHVSDREIGGRIEATDDVEGHGGRFPVEADDEGDDTEGHGIRGKA